MTINAAHKRTREQFSTPISKEKIAIRNSTLQLGNSILQQWEQRRTAPSAQEIASLDALVNDPFSPTVSQELQFLIKNTQPVTEQEIANLNAPVNDPFSPTVSQELQFLIKNTQPVTEQEIASLDALVNDPFSSSSSQDLPAPLEPVLFMKKREVISSYAPVNSPQSPPEQRQQAKPDEKLQENLQPLCERIRYLSEENRYVNMMIPKDCDPLSKKRSATRHANSIARALSRVKKWEQNPTRSTELVSDFLYPRLLMAAPMQQFIDVVTGVIVKGLGDKLTIPGSLLDARRELSVKSLRRRQYLAPDPKAPSLLITKDSPQRRIK